MENNLVWIVLVKLKYKADGIVKEEMINVSQDCYKKYEDAKNFCLSREDGKIREVNKFRFESEDFIYLLSGIYIT